MVIINTTGKINEVWLDKPYGTIIVDCPDTGISWESGYTSGYTDGLAACSGSSCDGIYESGYTAGEAAQKAKLSYTAITENGEYTSEDGFSAVTVNVPSGETIRNQFKDLFWTQDAYDYEGMAYILKGSMGPAMTSIKPDSGYTGLREVQIYNYIWAGEAYQDGYNSGYTAAASGNPGYDEGYEVGFDEGYTSGVTDQKNKLASTAITQNGTYIRPDGWSFFTVTVPQTGYTQADLDAAFASGFSAGYDSGLTDCSGYTPVSGDSVLDFVYETTEPNQTISLFHGDAPNNGWFELFFSALTAIEIGGVSETPDASNIQVRNSVSSYTHTFATAGKHQVKFTVSDDYTDALGHNPARMLKQLLFSLELDDNLNNLCPLVEANIGEGYEVIYFGAFTDQHGLTGLTLPDTLTTLSGYPFEATGLIDVTIPESVTAIGHKSFYNCSAITAMTFEGLTPPTLSGTEPLGSTAYTFPIYVPCVAVEDYKTEFGPDYASRITCDSGHTPTSGYTTLEITYSTSASNQTINLFNGGGSNLDNNVYFNAFYSAITFMEIDGVAVLPNTADIDDSSDVFCYTHTFQSAGLHTVKYYMDTTVSAVTNNLVKYPAYELSNGIFRGRSGLTPIVYANIGDGYEKLTNLVFNAQGNMTGVTLPATLNDIFPDTFENTGLEIITCYATTPPIATGAFYQLSTLQHVYVPAESVDAYKAANGWKNHAGVIEAIQ